jgi:hypothetical protein
MSDYANAPATKLLASHCACCSRPLVDAKSVEVGVGPDCRAKYGFDIDVSEDARTAANGLVYRIAANQKGAQVNEDVNALRHLGFVKLADCIARRLAHVIITREGGEIVVRSPFSPEAVTELRKVPGRRWDAQAKRNRFPESAAHELVTVLKRCFPGATACGPKGLFVLA